MLRGVQLLPLDEVRRRLGITGRSYEGVRPIEVARIVGSVDRSADFRRDFRARRVQSGARLASLREAFPDGGFPPIEVFEVGGAYFVADGHHRTALARERRAEYIDAAVTRLHTTYDVPADVDVARLVHTEQQRRLMRESGLATARPDAVIEFARPRGYPELLEVIKAHGYDLARDRGALPAREEVAADFHDRVYRPGVAAAHAHGMPTAFPFKTEADLFLWLYERRRDLRVLDPDSTFDDAARFALEEGVGWSDRRVIRREAARPLSRSPRSAGPPGRRGR